MTAAFVLIITYIGVVFTRLPRVNIDRPSAAFTGGVLMVLLGVLSFEEAIEAIDFNIIALLLGMMILVSTLKIIGFFNLLALKILSLAKTPYRLLLIVILVTAISSAFLVNDAVVLLFTPIVIQICRTRQVNPVPYLIAEAMASNIGSTTTIVGNPQNMLIGVTSGISFARFFLYLLPVSFLSTIVLISVIYFFYGKVLEQNFSVSSAPSPNMQSCDIKSISRLVPILALVMIAFFLSSLFNLELPLIALGCAALFLLIGKVKPSNIMREVDWVLLLFFAGLFVVIEGAYKSGILDIFIERVEGTPNVAGIASISVVSTVVSQIVSNVPLTILLLPILKNAPGDTLWIALAAGSTLGGNLTIIGAVANIIVVEGAAKEGVQVGFLEFLKVGAVVTSITVCLAIFILGIEYWIGWLK